MSEPIDNRPGRFCAAARLKMASSDEHALQGEEPLPSVLPSSFDARSRSTLCLSRPQEVKVRELAEAARDEEVLELAGERDDSRERVEQLFGIICEEEDTSESLGGKWAVGAA